MTLLLEDNEGENNCTSDSIWLETLNWIASESLVEGKKKEMFLQLHRL